MESPKHMQIYWKLSIGDCKVVIDIIIVINFKQSQLFKRRGPDKTSENINANSRFLAAIDHTSTIYLRLRGVTACVLLIIV